jgi:hypothetical protein
MKKLLSVLITYTIIGSLAFALATPVNIILNTIIVPFSSLTINGGNDSTDVQAGQTTTIPYLYYGNELVDISITSAGGMNLVHLVIPEATIPYTIQFDYDGIGPLGYTTVVNGDRTPLIDTHGVYNLNGNFTITVDAGRYQAGRYSDTLTFAVTSR